MSRKPVVETYRDNAGEYRWRIRSSNGNIIAESSEGYRHPADRNRSLTIALDALTNDDVDRPQPPT
jgi:hypothetical protein